MATEFIQRIVIDGPAEDVKRLESALVRTGERRSRRKRWVERVPFSFEAVWELAQLSGTPPYDPYDLSEFRRRTTEPGYAEKRYSFLTRNMTAADVLTPHRQSVSRLRQKARADTGGDGRPVLSAVRRRVGRL